MAYVTARRIHLGHVSLTTTVTRNVADDDPGYRRLRMVW